MKKSKKKKPSPKRAKSKKKAKPMGGIGVPETNVNLEGMIQPEETPDATV